METSKNTRIGERFRHREPRSSADLTRVPADDRGFSLVEVVCTITLMGILIIPLVQAIFTSIVASSTSRQVAEIETVLQNAADRVNRAPVTCDGDGYTLYVEAAALSKGWSKDQATATYQYYAPGSSALIAGTWKPGICPVEGRGSGMVQLVSITVQSETGRVVRSIKVVKSDV